jgi:hypothetical protein
LGAATKLKLNFLIESGSESNHLAEPNSVSYSLSDKTNSEVPKETLENIQSQIRIPKLKKYNTSLEEQTRK